MVGKHFTAIIAFTASVASSVLLSAPRLRLFGLRLPRSVLACIAAVGLAVAANESLGKPVMFLRWSYVRFLFGLRHMGATWQVGDGREQALGRLCVRARAQKRRRRRHKGDRRVLLHQEVHDQRR